MFTRVKKGFTRLGDVAEVAADASTKVGYSSEQVGQAAERVGSAAAKAEEVIAGLGSPSKEIADNLASAKDC